MPNVKHKVNIADVITASRIIFAVCILFCPTFTVWFYTFYLLGAFTDMIDGSIARKLNLKSSFGAKLDTTADFIFIMAVMANVLVSIYVPKWIWIWIVIIAFVKLLNLISSLTMYHKIVPMHTIMNKVTGFMLFCIPFAIGTEVWHLSVVVTSFVATLAAIQEGHYIRTRRESV